MIIDDIKVGVTYLHESTGKKYYVYKVSGHAWQEILLTWGYKKTTGTTKPGEPETWTLQEWNFLTKSKVIAGD